MFDMKHWLVQDHVDGSKMKYIIVHSAIENKYWDMCNNLWPPVNNNFSDDF